MAAAADDEAARDIVREGARQLARLVSALLDRLDFAEGEARVVPFGGLLGNDVYLAAFREAVMQAAPQATILAAPSPAIVGAVVLAAQLTGTALSSEAIVRLTREVRRRLCGA